MGLHKKAQERYEAKVAEINAQSTARTNEKLDAFGFGEFTGYERDYISQALSGTTGTTFYDIAQSLTLSGSAEQRIMQQYTRSIMYQNYVIIKQLETMNANLEKLLDK